MQKTGEKLFPGRIWWKKLVDLDCVQWAFVKLRLLVDIADHLEYSISTLVIEKLLVYSISTLDTENQLV
jgi:hypothetical protein